MQVYFCTSCSLELQPSLVPLADSSISINGSRSNVVVTRRDSVTVTKFLAEEPKAAMGLVKELKDDKCHLAPSCVKALRPERVCVM